MNDTILDDWFTKSQAAAGGSRTAGGGFPGREGLVKALRDYSPQARRHFTLANQGPCNFLSVI